MSREDKVERIDKEKRQGIIRLLLEQYSIPLLITVSGLLIEYHSGFFLSLPGQDPWPGLRRITTILLIAALLSFIWSTYLAVRCWIQMEQHFRETFALKAQFSLFSLAAVFTLSLISGYMPWSVGPVLQSLILGRSLPSITLPAEAYVLLLIISALLAGLPFVIYHQWSGRQSEAEYQREERGEELGLLRTGLREFWRIIHHEELLKPHIEARLESLFDPELQRSEIKPWKAMALELWEMHSKGSLFDHNDGWHEPPGCWVGINRHTGVQEVLYPVHDLDHEELRALLSYIDRLPRTPEHTEVVVMTSRLEVSSQIEIDARTIRIESEGSLISHLLDLDDYRNEIQRRVEEQLLPDSSLTLSAVVVPSQATIVESQEAQDVEAYLLNWLDEPGPRQLALLGEYGQGKSTTALMFTYHLLYAQATPPRRIPLLIELRGASPSGSINSSLGLLGAWAANYDLKPRLLELLNEAGRLVLIFEGFDELSQVGDPTARFLHFSALWRFRTSRSKLLFTGRPNLFRGRSEMERALGLKDQSYSGIAHCDALRLSFFTIDQIKQALRSYSPEVQKQICDLASVNRNFHDLVARPSLLHIVATLWSQENLSAQVDRLNSAFVMGLFIRNSYRRPGRKQNPKEEFIVLTTLERVYFMHGVAAYMIVNDLPNQIEAYELDHVIDRLIDLLPLAVSTSSPANSGETNIPLRDRIAQLPYGYEQVRQDVRTNGLLVDDPASIGTFKFAHKSFMEYMFAEVVADSINDHESYNTERSQAIFQCTGAKTQDILRPSAKICLDFLAEMLASSDSWGTRFSRQSKTHDTQEWQIFVTNQLLCTLINQRKPLNIKQRLEILLSIITIPNKGVTKNLLNAIYLFIFLLGDMIFVVIGMQFLLPIFGENMPQFFPVTNIWWSILILLFGLILMLMATYLRRLPRRYRSQLHLWYLLCRRLNISDQALHQCIGTSYFTRKKDQLFDYIDIPNSTEDGSAKASTTS
jgi:hypothetical protein